MSNSTNTKMSNSANVKAGIRSGETAMSVCDIITTKTILQQQNYVGHH